MRMLVPVAILGMALLAQGSQAAAPPSDWPALDGGAAQTNANLAETTLTARNVMSLKVRWTVPLPVSSYPIVSAGRVYIPVAAGKSIHARALDATTGKVLAKYSKGAAGGLLAANGFLYLAGRSLEVLDPSDGTKVAEIKGSPISSKATFVDPLADKHVVIAGYAPQSDAQPNSLYAISPDNQVLWHIPSTNAQGVIARRHVLAQIATGSAFYNEDGQKLSAQPAIYGDWFGGKLTYVVASPPKHGTAIYAYSGSGKLAWAQHIGPTMATQGWAHAVGPTAVYVMTERPSEGIAAFDPTTGTVLWRRSLPGIARLAYANGLLFALASGVAEPMSLTVYHADTGKAIGSISLTEGYYAFPALNELMIADGMVFIRVISPTNQPQLVALAP